MRIRTLKPEFWGDEKLAPMDPLTRLVFLGLISMADDAGRLLDSVKLIDGVLFAFSDDTSREALANLSRAGRITRGITASGQPVIQINGWHHQKIDHPNLKAALPPIAQALTEDSRVIREEVASDSRKVATLSVPVPATSTNDQRPSRGRKAARDEWFEEAWAMYPTRSGDNPKADALRSWSARLAEGVDPAAMLAGTQRYAAYCVVTAKRGTEFVMQARRFYGSAKRYAELWALPETPAKQNGKPTAADAMAASMSRIFTGTEP